MRPNTLWHRRLACGHHRRDGGATPVLERTLGENGGIRLAKKKLKMNRRRGESDDDSWAWMPTFGDRSRSSILRWGAVAAIAIVLTVGGAIGFGRLRDLVHRDARYARPLSLHWLDLPPWMASPDNAHIVRALTVAARLSAHDSMLDPKLSGRVGRALSEPAVGWIERVERVTVQTDGTVAVRCRFRRPTAWVLHKSRFYLVPIQLQHRVFRPRAPSR